MNSDHRSMLLQVLDYEDCGSSDPEVWTGFDHSEPSMQAESIAQQPLDRALEEEHARAVHDSFEAGKARGLEEGRKAEREVLATDREAEEARRKEQIANALNRFSEDRDRYFHAVEQEVVSLALAVAARILRRESQLDPLLLTGAVRVALGQLSSSTGVRLCVPPAELDMWQEAIAHLPNLKVRPDVEPGEGMLTGDCTIHTSVGTVDLGIRTQLSEIERGFFDQVARKRSMGQVEATDESEALR